MPGVTAVMAGANTAPAAWATACEIATGKKPVNQGSSTDAPVTSSAATAINPRFARVASTSMPAGVCARSPAAVAIDITTPIVASFHFCAVSR
jgi:hypothetical protein